MWNPNRAKFQSSTASPTWVRRCAIVFSAHNCGWFSMYKFLVNSWTLIASCYDPLRPRPRPRGSGRGKAARGYSLCMIYGLRQGHVPSLYLPLCLSLFFFLLSCNFPLAACLVQRLMYLCNATLAHYPLIHFRTSSPPDPSCPFWLLPPYRSFVHRWLWSSLPGTQISKSNADQITAIIMNAKQGQCMASRYPRAVKSLKTSNISIPTVF